MSKYLNNLVARSMKLAPVVQPRLASLFEASDTGPHTGTSSQAQTVPAEHSESSAPENTAVENDIAHSQARFNVLTPRTSAAVSNSISMIRARKDRIAGQSANEIERQFETDPRRSTAESARPSIAATVANDDKLAMMNGQARPATQLVDHPPSRQAVQARVVEKGLTTVTVGPEQMAAATQLSLTQANQPARRNLNLRDAIDAVTGSPGGTRKPGAQELSDQRRAATTRNVLSHSVIRSDEPPTINVTIGRIDVRAIFPAPPTPRPARAARPAPMSLDQYLKERGGRR
jgi:hypothetical protein